MSKREYFPDDWVVVRCMHAGEPVYKILAGWSGSYLHGASWKLSSGTVSFERDPEFAGSVIAKQYSGSTYYINTAREGLGAWTSGLYTDFKATAEAGGAEFNLISLDEAMAEMEAK